ncbi:MULTISPECIES: MATE family efflux transporter [Pseudovibrio]|uniref:MATE family efflux transporter n=1 Tax=Stappiaceae TaxID=2821832 RepID=UPI002365B97C|nr:MULTISPECIES: MATE family efflux transporter [Pseudovibrio]MDD7911879.1 MATE family efflux transporter [Pseudovibrio exalbescens]MDX5594674.1 MATE family efflux transporter [Pseudovibrio sp. SPO723]
MTPVEYASGKRHGFSSWLAETKAMLILGVPLIGAQLAQMAINATDTLMIGWLGATELAASVLALQLFFMTWLAGLGIIQAVMPLASRAEGQGDVRGVRRAARMGIWIAVSYTSLGMVLLWHGESILLYLQQDPEVSKIAGEYLRVVQWSMYPSLIVVALRCFLTCIQKAQIVLWATLVSAVVNAVLDYGLIFGHWGFPEMGILGAAIASIGTAIASAVFLVVYILWEPKVRTYDVFVRIWRADWGAFFEILRLGWPISLMLLAETGLFGASAFMMGWIGTLELAAHGIAVQLAGIAFMIPVGFSNAATARVGQALGRNDEDGLRRSGWVAICLAGFFAVIGSMLFWLFPEALIGLYLDESNPYAADVLRLGIPLLAIAALFQLADGVQGVAAGVLRGMSDTTTPMIIAIIGYWAIGFTMAYVLAFPMGYGPEGIWAGLAAGLMFCAVVLTVRFHKRKEWKLVRF